MGRAVLFNLGCNEDMKSLGLFDIDEKLASEIAHKYGGGKALPAQLDATDVDAATRLLSEYDVAVSCVSYSHHPGLTRAAIRAKCHFTDLGGNNDVVRTQLAMDDAKAAGVIVIPD